MEMKYYGDRMLEKQMGYAEKKGNKEYAEACKAELAGRKKMRETKRAAKRAEGMPKAPKPPVMMKPPVMKKASGKKGK